MSKRITIKKVAEEADVSVASVSRAFNKPESVAAATRERIMQVADELQYRPNNAARSLITNRTSTIGAILPDLHGSFFSEIIRGIDQAARERGYHLLLSSSHSTREERDGMLQTMNGRIDGLLLMAPDLDVDALESNLPRDVPVHLLNCRAEGEKYGSVCVDNIGGARLAVDHLVGLGHQTIAILKGTAGNLDAEERLQGFQDAKRDRELSVAEDLEVQGQFTEISGYIATKELLDQTPSVTAIFASNDSMAIGALRALSEASLKVPEDISLIGFDDIPMAAYTSPPLTTIHVDILALGAQGVRALLSQLLKPDAAIQETVAPTTLIERGSCARAVQT